MDAPNKAIEIKAAITAALAVMTALWGWIGWLIVIFAACVVLDYLTGTWAAHAAGEWSSTVARQGLWHKLGEIVALLVAALCDIALRVVLSEAGSALPITHTIPCLVTPIVALWYIFTELGSIIENTGKLGAPIPSWLRKMIAQLREQTEKTAEENLINGDAESTLQALKEDPEKMTKS